MKLSLPDGRPLTSAAVITGGFASGAFNVWGAFHLYSGFAAWIFTLAILAFEVFAVLALRHIIEDWNNHHHLKAIIGGLVFALAITGCFTAGKHAFHLTSLEVREANKARMVKAEREKARAERLYTEAKPFEAAATDSAHPDYQKYHALVNGAERAEDRFYNLSLEIEKNRLPPNWLIVLLLVLFEANKALGRWSVATPTTKTWSRAQRRAHKAKNRAKGGDDNIVPLGKPA